MSAPPDCAQSEDSTPSGGMGLYVHFPWCLKKCPYCDFLSVASERQEIPRKSYTKQVCAELSQRAAALPERRLTSVFFGGGTPSLWGAAGIAEVLERVRSLFTCDGTEISVECNPTSLDGAQARALRDAGVNRLSIGVQSLDEQRLSFLGRLHDCEGGLRAVSEAVSSGVAEVSADLIFGVAGQRPEEAANEAQALAKMGLSHLSAYALTIEAGTQFGALHHRGLLPLLPDETVAECFTAVEEALLHCGFQHYEISNYCQPGHPAHHNLGYWQGRHYLGVGLGAWGTVPVAGGEQIVRYRNTVSVERYLNNTTWPVPGSENSGPGQIHADFEELDAETRLVERLLLGLRLSRGVDVPATLYELAIPSLGPRRLTRIERLAQQGQLEWDGTRLAIPQRHWLRADGLIAQIA